MACRMLESSSSGLALELTISVRLISRPPMYSKIESFAPKRNTVNRPLAQEIPPFGACGQTFRCPRSTPIRGLYL